MKLVEKEVQATHTFSVSYFSEVSITIEVRREKRWLKYTAKNLHPKTLIVVEALHPIDYEKDDSEDPVGLKGSWFHFSGGGKDEIRAEVEVDDHISEREAILRGLQTAAEELAPGAIKMIHQQESNEYGPDYGDADPRDQFHADFLFAFVTGGHTGAHSNVDPDRLPDDMYAV